MATQTKRYYTEGVSERLADVRNAYFPFEKNVLIFCHRYVVGTDFTSGDDLLIELDGAQEILFAVAKTPSNTLLSLTEAALSTRTGKSITTGTSTTDIEIFIVVRV